jgi:glycosyltransferase involved in cell wall biosynthesis
VTIALDATYSVGDQLSGVGIYSREVLGGLAAAYPDTRFEFWYRPHRFFRALSEPWPANVHRRLLTSPFAPRGAALFHGLNQRLPEMRMRRAVATFHDLFVLSGSYSTPEFRARFAAQAREAAARADAIITVSAFTKSQVTELLGVQAERIHVVHHGIRSLTRVPVRRENVVLNVGAVQARKNLVRLVEAFETLNSDWKLVLAGSAGYGAEKVFARIQASPARERIEVTGYVTAAELAAWYSRARIFAFPSLDEGFGMPVLEAMAAGVAVITSNRSALPEVAGDAALLVDPDRGEALVEALRELAKNEDRRNSLVALGEQRAKLFTWERAVRETWDVYRRVLG